jgi:protein gp37
MGQPNYVNGFGLTIHERALDLPSRWKTPQVIFVNSMSDLFHEEVPLNFIQKVFEVMNQTNRHRYQVLTKRSKNLVELNKELDWTENIWMGVSVESEKYKSRIDDLRKTGAKVKFLSLEPLLGPLPKLDLTDIDWVIVGGESGPGARPLEEEWVTDIRDQCQNAGIPFFFKQWGGTRKKKAGRLLQGRIWNEIPAPFNLMERYPNQSSE